MADQEQNRATVLVGCKMSNGLRLHVMKRMNANPEPVAVQAAPTFKDMGFIDLGGHQSGTPRAPGSPARTEAFTSVDKELFDTWMEENADSPLVKSGMVFVSEPARAEEPDAERRDEDEDAARREEEARQESEHQAAGPVGAEIDPEHDRERAGMDAPNPQPPDPNLR